MPGDDRTSLVGPALTAASVLISAAALVWSWQQDRQNVIRSQAQELRTVIADTIAAFDRLESVSLLLFDEVQPDLVEASEKVATDLGLLPIPARDFLWRRINERKLQVLQSIVTSDIADRVARLYAYHPAAYTASRRAVERQRNVFQSTVDELLTLTQRNILGVASNRDNYRTADLGNELRGTTLTCEAYFRDESSKALAPIRAYLASLVAASDRTLLQRSLLPEEAKVETAQQSAATNAKTLCGVKEFNLGR